MTPDIIASTASDKELLEKLFSELEAAVPADLHDNLDEFVETLQDLSPGLRAMASTYQFDVSMTLDDLGWHFANWHHHGYARETGSGLRELEAGEVAEIFDRAYSIACHEWDRMTRLLDESFDAFSSWYGTSELEATLMPLNRRLWELFKIENSSGQCGIFKLWVDYARRYPDRVAG